MGEAASAKWRIFRSFWLTSENPYLLGTSVESPEKFAGCCELFCPLARPHRGVAAQRCDLWSVESFVALGRGGLRGQRLTLRVGPVPSEKSGGGTTRLVEMSPGTQTVPKRCLNNACQGRKFTADSSPSAIMWGFVPEID